jgi:hypothetical protein
VVGSLYRLDSISPHLSSLLAIVENGSRLKLAQPSHFGCNREKNGFKEAGRKQTYVAAYSIWDTNA